MHQTPAVIKVSFFESVVRDHSKDPPGGRAYVAGTRSLRSVVHHYAGLHSEGVFFIKHRYMKYFGEDPFKNL